MTAPDQKTTLAIHADTDLPTCLADNGIALLIPSLIKTLSKAFDLTIVIDDLSPDFLSDWLASRHPEISFKHSQSKDLERIDQHLFCINLAEPEDHALEGLDAFGGTVLIYRLPTLAMPNRLSREDLNDAFDRLKLSVLDQLGNAGRLLTLDKATELEVAALRPETDIQTISLSAGETAPTSAAREFLVRAEEGCRHFKAINEAISALNACGIEVSARLSKPDDYIDGSSSNCWAIELPGQIADRSAPLAQKLVLDGGGVISLAGHCPAHLLAPGGLLPSDASVHDWFATLWAAATGKLNSNSQHGAKETDSSLNKLRSVLRNTPIPAQKVLNPVGPSGDVTQDNARELAFITGLPERSLASAIGLERFEQDKVGTLTSSSRTVDNWQQTVSLTTRRTDTNRFLGEWLVDWQQHSALKIQSSGRGIALAVPLIGATNVEFCINWPSQTIEHIMIVATGDECLSLPMDAFVRPTLRPNGTLFLKLAFFERLKSGGIERVTVDEWPEDLQLIIQ